MKKEFIWSILAILILIVASALLYYLLVVRETSYYTQVDNGKVKELETGKYEYTLIAYHENGEKREIKFQTTRKLREGAYLQLDVMFFRGVVRWREVSINDIPIVVREKYSIKSQTEEFFLLFCRAKKRISFVETVSKIEKMLYIK